MQEKFDKKKYDREYNKERRKKIKQFNVDMKIEEKEELDRLLDSNNLSKVDFLKNAIKNLKRGENMKITKLKNLNELNQKAELLCNAQIHNNFYDFYFENELEWLLDNQELIEKDYSDNFR